MIKQRLASERWPWIGFAHAPVLNRSNVHAASGIVANAARG